MSSHVDVYHIVGLVLLQRDQWGSVNVILDSYLHQRCTHPDQARAENVPYVNADRSQHALSIGVKQQPPVICLKVRDSQISPLMDSLVPKQFLLRAKKMKVLGASSANLIHTDESP